MNKFYKISNFIMFLLIIFLSINIFNKNFYFDFNKEYFNNLLNITFNFKNIFVNFNKNNMVSNECKYINIDENKYISSSNLLFPLKDGNVIFLTSTKIIIDQMDGYILNFIGDFSLYVCEGDYVDKNNAFGEYFEPFYMFLIKGEQVISYEEYIGNTV